MKDPDVIILMTDEERAIPCYEDTELLEWRDHALQGRKWFRDNGVSFERHYTGSLACVPSRPTLFTGQYPDVHGVTQTDGLGKEATDSRMRWLIANEVPTIGHWFRAAGYDTHYDGKWHMSHADLTDSKTGQPLATNTSNGEVIQSAVNKYISANPLDPYGFSGWVGPEPHGAPLENSGVIRDPLIADRVVNWLTERYKQRTLGNPEALKPFLLVASFVNPHDIVLFPAWRHAENNPLEASDLDPPEVAAPPTRFEDLSTKPAAQIAYKHSYYSGYGPQKAVQKIYESNEQAYRNLYYRLHLEVDGPLDRVRKTITGKTSRDSILFRTSDHGDLLGAHGGLHQKWFNLYDEASRVPFEIVKINGDQRQTRCISDIPTSHVDLIPTALSLAGLDQQELSLQLSSHFSELHPLPGKDLSPLLQNQDDTEFRRRAIYFMTRDNILEGDTLASAMARRFGQRENPSPPMKIQVPAHVSSNFEGIVAYLDSTEVHEGSGSLWKITRAFDDPATWSQPHIAHLSASGPTGNKYRTEPLPDQWELYNLTLDPTESHNLWKDPTAKAVFEHMKKRLRDEVKKVVPQRNNPRPYAKRQPPEAQIPTRNAPLPARAIRLLVRQLGMHPNDTDAFKNQLPGRRVLIVCTNTAWLEEGKPTGLFSSEMTAPYYLFTNAGITVDLASPLGGVIPIDPISFKPVIRSHHDDRFLKDDLLNQKVSKSIAMEHIDVDSYNSIYFAGGWGAAFDLGFSEIVGDKITEANSKGKILGGVCHGPLGFLKAKATNGTPLVQGRRITAVTDKQVLELGVNQTPHHPETELRQLGADFRCTHRFRDPFANHWEVDGNLVTGQNQNAGPMVAREIMKLLSTLK
jgi:arylsulfatase A-like enzyme/putative intracellular protease/amidase